jgi:hypothetical protein
MNITKLMCQPNRDVSGHYAYQRSLINLLDDVFIADDWPHDQLRKKGCEEQIPQRRDKLDLATITAQGRTD